MTKARETLHWRASRGRGTSQLGRFDGKTIAPERTGIDIAAHVRFDKHRQAIRNGLKWLDDSATLFAGEPHYGAFHLVCMWDHLVVSEYVEMDHPRLADIVANVSRLPYVAASALP